MTVFEPFRAVRYDDPDGTADGVLDLDTVISPLETSTGQNAEKALAGVDRYNAARLLDPDTGPVLWSDWLESGFLRRDDEPAFYLYRIGRRDLTGAPLQVTGVVGMSPDASAPADRLIVPKCATVAAAGFTDLLEPQGMPLARATDSSGAHHRLWRLTSPGVIGAISDAVATSSLSEAGGLLFVSEAGEPQGVPVIGMLFGEAYPMTDSRH